MSNGGENTGALLLHVIDKTSNNCAREWFITWRCDA